MYRRWHARRSRSVDIDDLDDRTAFEHFAHLFCVPLFVWRGLGGRARKGLPERAAKLVDQSLTCDGGCGRMLFRGELRRRRWRWVRRLGLRSCVLRVEKVGLEIASQPMGQCI